MNYVLIVEDDLWMADCYRLWLAQAGYTTAHARSAQEALDQADAELPIAIVLDLFLPSANGIQLLHTLRSHADLARIPVVLCSSVLPEGAPDLKPYGVAAILDKTLIGPRDFCAAVSEIVRHAAV